jgi:hypothetical protein
MCHSLDPGNGGSGMVMAVWEMSETELSRLDVIRDVDRGRMTVAATSGLLALERRQVFRLLKTFGSKVPLA